jgi:hypothetical protein
MKNIASKLKLFKENAEFKCSEALELFMSNPDLLKETKMNAKYEK